MVEFVTINIILYYIRYKVYRKDMDENKLREYIRQIITETLNEGLITTYPIDSAIRHLCKKFGMTQNKDMFKLNFGYIYGCVTKTDLDNGENGIMVIMPNREREIKSVIKELDVYGYFKSIDEKIFGGAYINMMFEKKHEDDISKKVRKLNTIWHVSPIKHKNKILKMGLCPKTKIKKGVHPDRIYFALDINTAKNIKKDLSNFYSSEEMVSYKIQPKLLPKSIKFYYDPNALNCVYTMDNISPEYIEIDNKIV